MASISCSMRPASATICRITCRSGWSMRCPQEHYAQRHHQSSRSPDSGRRALCGVPHRAPDHRRRHIGRILQNQSASGDAGYPDPLSPVQHRQDGREAASVLGILGVDLPIAPRKPRLAPHQERRSGGAARNPHQLSRHRDRSHRQRRRPEDIAQDFKGSGVERLCDRRDRSRRQGVHRRGTARTIAASAAARSIIRHRPAGWATIRWRWSISA